MVQTSLTYGMSPLSGVGFALFGNYLALAKGEVEEGYRYVKFALSLMKRMPSIAHDSEIMYYSAHTRIRVEPIQSAIEHYIVAQRGAMASGAVRNDEANDLLQKLGGARAFAANLSIILAVDGPI
eukprot:scaffold16848_cov92-Skeletonema_dohrnii-CCMP3373.AAC.1